MASNNARIISELRAILPRLRVVDWPDFEEPGAYLEECEGDELRLTIVERCNEGADPLVEGAVYRSSSAVCQHGVWWRDGKSSLAIQRVLRQVHSVKWDMGMYHADALLLDRHLRPLGGEVIDEPEPYGEPACPDIVGDYRVYLPPGCVMVCKGDYGIEGFDLGKKRLRFDRAGRLRVR